MTWEDNLKEAAYTSASGNRLTFEFEDLSQKWTRKTTAFDFSNVDGTWIQNRGRSGRRFPMRCIFWGDTCDVEAEGFATLLNESGIGRLEHPFYGDFDVVPFGDIARRDDLKTAANQVVLEVAFWETLGVIYPADTGDKSGEVSAAVDAYNAASAAQLERQIDISTETKVITFKDRVESFLGRVSDTMATIADQTEKVNNQFNSVVDSINGGIDVLVRDPLTLAFQVKIATQAPARAASSITARLDAYANLASEIYAEPDYTTTEANLFHTRDLYVGAYASGMVVSALNHEFSTRGEALDAAFTLLSELDLLTAWREANLDALASDDTDALPSASLLDPGDAYAALLYALGLCAGYLVDISFSLKQERTIVLTTPRNFLELGFELYGADFEGVIDFFIASNELTNAEILELPRGRRVKYYV